ncbi:hypothetical protein [Nocardioides sp.]|uniref:hypothetical protein n=1 Tax=Nocardioides sp. TaxID=35761 RepID=UPI002736E89F|nr:hypothetical protein [Nocardioides sp.]MDP3893158.1 hypothetical protein [Nocardioides sp.]
METILLRTSAALLAALLFSGCGESSSERGEDPVTTPDQTSGPDEPGEAAATKGPAAEAVADLVARLDLGEEQVEVVAVEEVTWRDGSLGCAEPDMMYTQALVDGTRITLRAEGTTYEYHAGGTTPAFLCEAPTE